MPELPEVETVRAALARELPAGTRIDRLILNRRSLRAAIPAALPRRLAGAMVQTVRRRAKYLLIGTDRATMLCHLGMTGNWRLAVPGDDRRHDHAILVCADGRRLAFNDPRRFGLLDLVAADGSHPALDELGPEPLEDAFTPAALAAACRRHARAAIKAVIMDQRVVVGVGNIYAAESLFAAGIRPTLPAGRLRADRLAALHAAIRRILAVAIAAGGSSIDDFRHPDGTSGYFQLDLAVYGRGGQPCRTCGTTLRSRPIAGRASVWCPQCQH
jgi:formamidopyrimidine-DNA glycosylase